MALWQVTQIIGALSLECRSPKSQINESIDAIEKSLPFLHHWEPQCHAPLMVFEGCSLPNLEVIKLRMEYYDYPPEPIGGALIERELT